MYTGKQFIVNLLSALLLCSVSLAMADSPANIDSPDRHSVEVKGKIKLYRVQTEGMNLGKGSDEANAEVFVTLDSDPKMVYTLQLHADSPAINQVMADTLRDAFVKKLNVTLYHQMSINDKTNNLKILMVQLSR